LIHQLIFFDQMPAVFDQQLQQVESPQRKRHRLAIPQQQSLSAVQSKRTKLENFIRRAAHISLNGSLTAI